MPKKMNGKTPKIGKKASRLVQLVWLIIAACAPVKAQNLHQWGNIGLFHGLPSDKVNTVTQTADGVFWFGTENGLARFDGRRVQRIALDGVTQILSLATAPDGTLWIGTNNGVFFGRNDKFNFVSPTQGKQINAISVGEKNLVASQTGELLEVGVESVRQLAVVDVPVTAVAASGEQIYFGTEGRGLFEIRDGLAREFKVSFRPYFINDLVLDNARNLWLAARARPVDSGLFRFSSDTLFTSDGDRLGAVTSLKFDENLELWLGSRDNGVYRFRNGVQVSHFTFENTSGGLRSNQIFDVFVDREGVIWFGTDKGACRFDSRSPLNFGLTDDPGDNFVRKLYPVADGRIYAGTNKGLYLFDGEQWRRNEEFAGKSVYAIGQDVQNQLVIGTANDNIRSIAVLNGKTYRAVFGKGIFENEKLIFAHDSLLAMYRDGHKLYLGTVADGLLEFENGRIRSLEILTNNAIREIDGSSEKGLWLATEKGLFLWQNNELKAVIGNIEFRSILVREEKVLAGTVNRGLFQVKFDPDFGWMTSNLNVEQGLPSAGVFAIVPLENAVLIGTGKGISRYIVNRHPAGIIANRVISERVHSPQEIAGGINLDFPQNTLAVEVTGLSSRTFPENFQYGYVLTNKEGKIILKKLTKDSQISFENLEPGNYLVEIVAFNQDLIPSAPLKFAFSVAKAPFPWTSTALAILLLVTVIALVMAIIERRQIVAKNKEIAAARFDLTNEAERERRRIARDLHDQTLADLRKLMLKSDQLPGEAQEFRHEIEAVSDEIRRICEDLSPSVLENVGLSAALEFLLSNTVDDYKFSCPDGLEEKFGFAPSVQMQIYRIAQEVLNNIKRHAGAGFVEMRITDGEIFRLTIENDGKPFLPDFANLPKGRGISNIKSRAELIEAEISWENSADGRTIFTLQK
jgi:signal transduction histidine kinase/ligand-binding sensor domain-containing protein